MLLKDYDPVLEKHWAIYVIPLFCRINYVDSVEFMTIRFMGEIDIGVLQIKNYFNLLNIQDKL